ncbi:MAG: hypothetical protein ABIG92_06770 [Candidatus Omnitrophota bacterium]
MKTLKVLLGIVMLAALTSIAYSAPVGLASQDLDLKSGYLSDKEYAVTASVIGDFIDERKIDINKGSFEMDACFARIALSGLERFSLYVDLGSTSGMEYVYEILGEKYTSSFEDEFLWGIGGSAVIYKWDNGIEISALGSYREADMNIEKSVIDSATWTKSQMVNVQDGKYEEWQAGGEVAWKTEYITPYVAVRYSDVEVDAKFTVGGVERNASGKNSAENLGVAVGVTVTPKFSNLPASEQMAINVEGRFLDEEAINVGLTYRF